MCIRDRIIHFALLDHALMRTINRLKRHHNTLFHRSTLSWNEMIHDAWGKASDQKIEAAICDWFTATSGRTQTDFEPVSVSAEED